MMMMMRMMTVLLTFDLRPRGERKFWENGLHLPLDGSTVRCDVINWPALPIIDILNISDDFIFVDWIESFAYWFWAI